MIKGVSDYSPDEVWNRMVHEKDLSILSSIPHTVILTALQNNRKDLSTLASLQEGIRDTPNLRFGKKCKIQLILKQAILSEKQAQPHPFLTEEEKFLVACKDGDVPFLNHYYNNQDSSAYCFSELVGVCTKETLHLLLNLNPQLAALKDSSGNFIIHYAAIHNRADLIHLLLEREPSVQGDFSLVQLQGRNHNTPLHFASAEGCVGAAVALLEEKGSDQLSSADVDANLPIHIAAFNNQPEIIRLFLETNPEQRLKTGFRNCLPLHCAAERGCKEAAEVLLEEKALDQLLSADIDGVLPIHMAALTNQAEIIRLFLEKDPDQRLKTGFGNSLPLHYTAAKGYIEAAKVLLEEKGSDQLSSADIDGDLPIHMAAHNNQVEIIRLFLKRDPELRLKTGFRNWLPVHCAAEKGCIEAAKVLLEQKASDQLLSIDANDNLPIHVAARHNQAEIIHLFVKRDPELRLKTGFRNWLPVHCAAEKGCIEAAKVLLEQRALDQLLSANAEGNLPIHIAAPNNQPEMIRLFLERDPEQRLKTGFRNCLPLYYTAIKGSKEAAKVLLEEKALDQLLSANAEGNLPIHVAARNNQAEIIRLFLERDPEQRLKRGGKGYLPLHYAVSSTVNCLSSLQLLLEQNSKTQLEARDENNCLSLDLVNNEQGASFILASSITHGIKLVDTRDFFQKPLYRTVYKKIFLDFVKLFESHNLTLQDFNSLLNLAQWQASINHHFKEQIKNLKEQQLNHSNQTKEQLTQLKQQRDQFIFYEPTQFVGKLVACMCEILRKIKEDVAREEGEEIGNFPELLDQDLLLKQFGFMKQVEVPLRQLINCARKYEWTYDSSSASLTDLMNQLQNLISINKSKKLKDNQEIDVFGLLMEKFNVRTEADCQELLGCSFDKFYKLGLHAAADLQQICVISDDRESWISKVETLNLPALQDKITHFKELLVENNETELLSLEWVMKFELLKTYLKQNTSVATRVFEEYEVSTLSELWEKISSTNLQNLFNLKSLIRNWDSSEEKPPKIPKRES